MAMGPDQESQVAAWLERGQLEPAAELCQQHGDYKRALRLFEQACAFEKAAAAARLANEPGAAVRTTVLLQQEDRWQDLLVWLQSQPKEQLAQLAANLAAERRHKQAAELYRLADQAEESAIEFEKSGLAIEAAEAFEQAGLVAKAAAALEAGLRGAPGQDVYSVRLALGSLYFRYGKHEAAVRVLQGVAADAAEREQAVAILESSFERLGLEHARAEVQRERERKGWLLPVNSAEPAPAASAGTTVLFGRYVLQAELFVTPHARLVKAEDQLTGQLVALKILLAATHGAGRDALQRFVREAQALGKLRHPNVVPLLSYVPEGPAMVLPWMPGGSLEQLLEREPISPARAAEIATALLRALEQAHRLGILHRDVKPSNLLFDDGGTPYLADFGIAHLSAAEATVTAAAMGTVAYMSPEQRNGEAATAQSDLYAVGIMFRQMLTGKSPALDSEQLDDTLSQYHPDLTEQHAAVLRGFVQKRPEDRYSTAQQAREAVEGVGWSTRLVKPEAPASVADSVIPSASLQDSGQRLVPSQAGPLGPQHHDRWLEREVLVLASSEQPRVAAFARANHSGLATVLRTCPERQTVWVAVPPGAPMAGMQPFAQLDASQVEHLEAALAALHASGGVHGQVNASHVFRDADGCVVLCVPAVCPLDATPESDRAALRAMAGRAG